MTDRPRRNIVGFALLLAAVATWLGRESLAWGLTSLIPQLGYPLLNLWVQATAVLLVILALVRLRRGIAQVAGATISKIDSLEEKLSSRRGRVIRALLIGGGVGVAMIVAIEVLHLGTWLETRSLDLFFRLRFPERSQVELATGRELPSANKQSDVVVLALDDQTIEHLGWPMPRVYYARMIDAVAQAKPASLTIDVSLIDPSRDHPEWDAAIGESARRAGNVGFSFTVNRGARPVSGAFEGNLVPWHESASALPEYAELIGGDAAPQPVLEPIAKGANLVAMANVLLDGGDDVLRHSLLAARLGRELYPSLSLRVAAQALSVPLSDIHFFPGSHVDIGGKRRVPIDLLGRTRVRYQGRHDTRGDGPFRYVSIWSLIRADSTVTLAGNPMGDDQKFIVDDATVVTLDGVATPLAALEASKLAVGAVIAGRAHYSPEPGRVLELELRTDREAPAEPDFELIDEQTLRFVTTIGSLTSNRGDASLLAGKHVFVGSTALAAADLRSSPLGEIPGVEHHATMLANLLHDDFFTESTHALNAAVILGCALLAAFIGVMFEGALGLLFTALLTLLTISGSYVLSLRGFYLPVIGPAASVGITWLGCVLLGARASANARKKAESERAFVRQTFGRYLTEQVVQQLLDSPDGLKLGGQRDFVTIMMTDLRGFTSMCGSMEPENVVKLLNHYLEAMTRIIAKYGGTIDEFIGDAILVVFGAPLPLENEELRAAACAIEMLNAMPEVNSWNKANGLPEVEMGIGIHSGEVVLGNIGSELRAKYGIVGATINLTSRVESFTVGGQVLLSEATRERCGDTLGIGATQVVSPKGVKGTLTIHEALTVGAPFNVKLASADETLMPPRVPLEVRYGVVKGKAVSELTHVGHVEALSEQSFELRVDEPLTSLTDLQLRIVDGNGLRPGDVYGKVLRAEVRPNVIYLRLTSVPPEVKPVLEAARGGATPEKAPIPDSVLVSS